VIRYCRRETRARVEKGEVRGEKKKSNHTPEKNRLQRQKKDILWVVRSLQTWTATL